MRTALRAFLNQIVDYAGLFPPAKLPMETALESYLRGRKSSPHHWILGRFVCPTTRLSELASLVKGNADARAYLDIAALGQQSAEPGDFLATVRADIERIADFRAGWGSDTVIHTLETALPKGATIASLQAQLANVPDELAEAGLAGFLEVPMSRSWADEISDLCMVLHKVRQNQPGTIVGAKLRCGGLSADAFPSDAQVARFIHRSSAADLPWKATAGLHHPRRHWDESLQVWHHGFLNVFAAGVLADLHQLTEAQIGEILADPGEFFRFEDQQMFWRAWPASTDEIARRRATGPMSFGSCSFDEPCVDLASIGLLDVAP